jgi:hypothetical protein
MSSPGFFSEFISSSDLQMLLVAGLFFNHWYILLEFAEAELCSLLAFEKLRIIVICS